jgi:hypothetical protein
MIVPCVRLKVETIVGRLSLEASGVRPKQPQAARAKLEARSAER